MIRRTLYILSILLFSIAFANGEQALAQIKSSESQKSKVNAPQKRTVRIGRERWSIPLNDKYYTREISFTDAEDLLSKVPASALQKSLFYQGFLPEFFNDTEFLLELDYTYAFNEDLNPEDLKKDIEIIDAKKAFQFAQEAYFLPEKSMNFENRDCDYIGDGKRCARMARGNLANCYLSGIGVEKDVDKAMDILKKSPLFDCKSATEISYNMQHGNKSIDILDYYPPLIAYLYYNGIGVEKDIEKCNAILLTGKYPRCWENFYVGCFVPKDFDFAIYCLKIYDEKWADEIIVKIYAGEYNPKHKDLSAMKKYQEYMQNKKYSTTRKRHYRF